ncbi:MULTISPECIES: helix-turn-helix domain-containing protein [unclassified Clostridium]|uniref:helix-turn-helix domain-containing protein n=1 Tax=unclassified Clostridium TaxID=2614128 RepID=UPI0025BE9D7E|nr:MULTISPECIES: helix-turn-helix transcriptional regulator [unclassified Clostridium]
MFKLKIKEKRLAQHISQKELADSTDVSQSYLSSLETDDRQKSPTLRTIEKIAEGLNVCPLELIECNCCKCKNKDIG